MINFPSKYQFSEIEKKWQKYWQEKNTYKWDQQISRKDSYVIDTPPPTVSGQLHIGHVFSYTHTDFIARYKRMKGFNVFYPMGFDDNGLPTERLVEKKKKIRANQVDRQEFIAICQEVIEEEEEKFEELFNSIALSVDWHIKYRTIDPLSTKISQMSFLDLLEKGQIYRDSQPILWDPVDQTALSQADIEEKERTTFMNEVAFTTTDGKPIKIATTRPELLPACVAIFYHPEDKKYQHLEGQFAISPLFEVKIPILADDLVDPEKGTGLVMCCTFGDQTDILWWKRHKLPTKIIFTKHGKIIDDIPFGSECVNPEAGKLVTQQIANLSIKDAREKIIEILKEQKLLLSQTEKMQLVKCAERSGAPLEILTTPQWFVKSIEHKEAILEKSNELKWYPASMKTKLDSWVNGISLDWCISRQRYFGVPFPVWYSKRAGEEGKILLPKLEQLPIDPSVDLPENYQRSEVIADQDVMDTWSTSSVSPQLNSHGIATNFMANEQRHKELFPADLRPQAHEIIRTWAYYTMLKAQLHEGTLPWHNIMISGWCLAEDKTKMSKSKGNIISPVNLVNEWGADVIRYWSSSARLGNDTAYSADTLKNGKRLINKLYNAAKFVSQYFETLPDELKSIDPENIKQYLTHDIDKYFFQSLSNLISEAEKSFDEYDYATSMEKTERFFWDIFCDNYLEIVKKRAYNEDNNRLLCKPIYEEGVLGKSKVSTTEYRAIFEERNLDLTTKSPSEIECPKKSGALSAHLTLYHGFSILLKLFAPFLPHITEELYHILYSANSIHQRSSWPKLDLDLEQDYLQNSQILLDILELVRKVKAHDNVSIKTPVQYIEVNIAALPANVQSDLKDVTATEEIRFVRELSDDSQNLSKDALKIKVAYKE